MRGRGLLIGVAGVIALLAAGALWVTHESPAAPNGMPSLEVAQVLGAKTGGDEGYARARSPRPFHFPEDHGPHPDFQSEWWYWTGHLSTADGHDFGYQFTLFRSALAPGEVKRTSAWGARDLYMGHLTLSDVSAGRFQAFERFSRGALGLAGARTEPLRVWLEDWSAEAIGADALPLRLTAHQGDLSLTLELEQGKPPVLEGDQGLSQKGPTPGEASYYYSLTRMPTHGQVTVDGHAYDVTGQSWMDREWSTHSLGPGVVGWDWFSLQLSDGSELMYYQLRRRDGSVVPLSAGTLVPAQGEPMHLPHEDVRVEVLETWTSPHSGVAYPSRWRLSVPSKNLVLELTPALADQELRVSLRYWEGAVGLSGTRDGQPVQGRGYVELTGYGDAPPPGN